MPGMHDAGSNSDAGCWPVSLGGRNVIFIIIGCLLFVWLDFGGVLYRPRHRGMRDRKKGICGADKGEPNGPHSGRSGIKTLRGGIKSALYALRLVSACQGSLESYIFYAVR